MAQYTVKCPHCGNWTNSEINRSTVSKGVRGALKKGGMKSVLTAAGTVVPGFGNVAGFIAGTVIDAVYGDEINEIVDGAADMIMEDTTYSFNCPGCGHHWTMEEKEILKMIDEGGNNSNGGETVFSHYWDYFLQNTSEICDTRETLDNFMAQLDADMPVYSYRHLNYEYGAMQYLKSWAILIFILDNGLDEDLIKMGKTAADESHNGNRLDGEYKYMQSIYAMLSVRDNEPGAFGSCNQIFDSVKTIQIKDSLLKYEALVDYMNTVYYRKLSSIVYEIEQKERYQQALKLYKRMTKIDFFNAKLEGYGRLCQYYRFDTITGIENDFNKAFDYAKKCIEQTNIEEIEEYNPDNWFENLWMDNLSFAALMYAVENSPEFNPQKAYDLASVGYKLGDGYSTYLMGIFAQEGTLEEPNKSLAYKFFKEAVERGCEQAQSALEGLESEEQAAEKVSNNPSPEEQEYFDALQEYLSDGEISERERKMLERVRKALGISEERAAELEASLQQPKLNDDEMEYLEAYKEYLVDGEIDEKSRKRLEIFRKGLGLSEKRAAEIEGMV